MFLLTVPFPSHGTQSVQGAHEAPCCLVQARPLKTKPTFSFLSKHSFVNGSAANGLKGLLETSCVCRVAAATPALPHRHRALAGFHHPSGHLTEHLYQKLVISNSFVIACRLVFNVLMPHQKPAHTSLLLCHVIRQYFIRQLQCICNLWQLRSRPKYTYSSTTFLYYSVFFHVLCVFPEKTILSGQTILIVITE